MSKLTDEIRKLYDFKIKDNKVELPQFDFPTYVLKQLHWIAEYREMGITYSGALRAVLAEDEQIEADFDMGGIWEPASEEFKQWLNKPYLRSVRQMQIAVALVYGWEDPFEEDLNEFN